MKKLLIIFLTISNIVLSANEIDLINTGDRFVEIGFDIEESGVLIISENEIDYIKGLTKGIIHKPIIEISKRIEIDPSVWELFKASKGNLYNTRIEGLKPNSDYYIYLQSNSKFSLLHKFTTYERGPVEAAQVITYRKTNPGSIEFTWRPGRGQKRLVLARKGDYPDLPKNGVFYKSGEYGSDSARIGVTDTYVIFNGKMPKNRFIKLDNLDYDEYFFNVVEYNGAKNKYNYLPGKGRGNPSSNYPALLPPIAYEEYKIEDDVIFIDWSDVDGADYYEIVVSLDENFKNIIEEYDYADVGSQSEFAIYMDDPNATYYWMVRAVGVRSSSEFSNIVEVEKD